jgi:molybdopterin converting factor small subunit/ferritin-like metal-binding protein YciE
MAKPKYTEEALKLLSPEDLELYKEFQGSGQKYADEFLDYKIGGAFAEEAASGKPATETLGTIMPSSVVEPEVVDPTTFTEEEAPTDVALVETAEDFLILERERLAREAAKPVEEDFIIEGDVVVGPKPVSEEEGLPATKEEFRLKKATAEDIAEGTPVVEKVVPVEGEAPVLDEASQVQKFRAGLKDDERKAWEKFKDELIKQGSSKTEAEARASQLVAGIILTPRELGNYASKIAEATGNLDPEAFAEGNYSISDVFGRQALESTSQFKLRKSREERGAALRKIIEDRVGEELGLWQEGNLPSETQSFYVALKDRTAGGIDQQKVDAWKANRFTELVQQGEEDIRIQSRAFLLGSLAAEGKQPKEGSPEYKIVNDQADEISKLWLEEVNPELYAKRTGTEKGTLSKAAEYVLTGEDEKGQLYESKTGAGLRDLTGLIRTITQPAIRSITYDVNPDGSPVDPEDYNYKYSQLVSEATTKVADTIGRSDFASFITPSIVGLATLGTAFYFGSAREVGSGITKKPELSSGNYFNDTAFSIAVGRSLGDDYSDLHAAQSLYGKDSSLPFWFGISTEIALPILPTTVVGGAVGKLGSATAKISPRLGRGLGIAGKIIDSPISDGLAPLARRSVEVGKARAIGKAFDIGTEDLKLFDTKPVSDFVAETLAPKIADFILEGKPIPREFAALADEVGTDITSIDRALGRNLQAPLGQTKVGSYIYKVISNDIFSYFSDTRTVRLIEENVEVLNNPSSYTTARVEAAREGITLKNLYEDAIRIRGIVEDTGKLPEDELRGLLNRYEIERGADAFSGIKKGVADLIVADRLAEDLAKANYNDWVFISPTAIVKASKWKKVGAKVDTFVKEAVYGTKENKVIEGLIDTADNTVRLPDNIKTRLIKILSDELGAIKIESNPYWSGVLDKVAAGEKLLVEEVNSIINVVRTNFARTELGTSVVLPRQVSKLTERAAIPMGRRLPLIRGIEDVVRIPVIQKGIDALTNNRIAQSIARITRLDKVFSNLNKTIDAAPLPIANALKTLSTRINSLPQELIQDLRTAINAGEEGSVVFSKLIDTELLSTLKVAEDGTVAANDVANLYWDLLRRFFGIQNLSDAKLNETFLSPDGPIFSTLKPFTTEGRINLSDISGTLEGRSTIIALMEKIVSETRGANKDWINKGLKLLTDDAVSDLFVAKILDARKDALINDFAVDLATRNPELIISVKRSDKAKLLRDSKAFLTEDATKAYNEVVRITPDGSRWGNPISVSTGMERRLALDGLTEEVVAVEVIERDVKGIKIDGFDVGYNKVVDKLIRKAIIDEIANYISDGKAWGQVENDVYFAVTNSIIKKGVDDAAGIAADLSDKYNKIFNTEDIIKNVKTNLRNNYPKVNFDDYVAQTDEVSFIPPTKRADLKADIVMDPAKFTDDVAISSRIEEINEEIGTSIKPQKSELIKKIWEEGENVSDEITGLVEEHNIISGSLKVTPVPKAPDGVVVKRAIELNVKKLSPTQRAELKADVVMEPSKFTDDVAVSSRIDEINDEIGTSIKPQKSELIKKIWEEGENVSDEITDLVEEHTRLTNGLKVTPVPKAPDGIVVERAIELKVKKLSPTQRVELKADVVMDPARFTDDATIISRIEEINSKIGAIVNTRKSELMKKVWIEGENVSDEITSLVEEHARVTEELNVRGTTPAEDAIIKRSLTSSLIEIENEVEALVENIVEAGSSTSAASRKALIKERTGLVNQILTKPEAPIPTIRPEDVLTDRAFRSRLIEIEDTVDTLVDDIVEEGGDAVSASRKALVKERTGLVKKILAKPEAPIPIITPEDVLTNRVLRSRLDDIEDAVDTLVDNIVEEGGDAVSTSRKALVKERTILVKQILERADVSAYSETKNVIKFSKSGELIENIKNNMALINAADIENVLELSLNNVKAKLYTLGFDFKSGSGGYEAINAQMKSVGDLKLFLDPDSYKMYTEMAETNKFLNAALEDLSASNKEAKEFIASRFSWALGTLRRNAIGGMLGGIYTLNGRFLGVNNVTAPIIASVTAPQYVGTAILNIPKAVVRPIGRAAAILGEAGVGATLGGAATFAATGNPALAVAGSILGTGVGAGIRAARKPVGAAIKAVGETRVGAVAASAGAAALTYLRQGFRGLTGTTMSDVIITPSGKVYTDVELTAAFRNNVYKMSQYDFDFSSSILQDVKRAAEINEAGYDAAFLERVRRNYGPLTRNTSAFNIIGSEADYVFREAVFKEALRSGSTEGEAADFARNVLLDYSKVSDWERKLISSWMLFYSFMRQSTVESIQGLFRPDAAKYLGAQARIQKATEDNALKRHNAYVAKYASTRMYAWTDGQTYDGYKTGFYGPANPVFESYSRVLGGVMAGVDAYNKEKLLATIAGGTFDVLTSQPHFEFAKNMSLLLQKSPNAPHGYYPSAALAQHVTMGDIELLKDRYDLKPVEDKDGKPVLIKPGEPTWNGRQWKFNSAKGKIAFEADVLQGVLFGYERSVKDWAIATSIANGVDPAGAELKRYKDGNVYLYHVGLQSPMPSPEWLRAQEELAKQLSRELQYAAEGKDPNSIIERINAEN